ncbi:MAG: hypothetical protein LAT78_09010 [Roseinatronobacter sp.]|nr:hypothetical protein [Roseinatronobacter sp.]
MARASPDGGAAHYGYSICEISLRVALCGLGRAASEGVQQVGDGNKAEKRLLNATVALEGLRAERDFLRAQVNWLQRQLQNAIERAERSEDRLHEVTLRMAELSHEAITAPTRSGATEVLMDGKSILRLSNPISGHR